MNNLDYELNQDVVYCFLKFGSKTRLETLQNGKVYMKNLKYFKELEKTLGQKGMGDVNEATCIINDCDIKLIEHETGKEILVGKARSSCLEDQNDLLKPVFCLYAVDSKFMKITHVSKKNVKATLLFSDEQKSKIISDFGDSVLVISPNHFMNSFLQACERENLNIKGDKVQYSDFSINYKERLESYFNRTPNKFFWKDQSFCYQNEYRIVILNKLVDDSFTLDIGDISSFSTIMPANELLTDRFEFVIRRDD